MRRLVAVAVLLTALAACTNDNEQAGPPPVAWTKVDVPAEPVVLTEHGDELLVGMRHRGATVVPELLLLDAKGQQKPIPVKPNPASPYAFEAIWYSIAYDGKQLLALGGAAGGAHSNTRWTVWTGSPQTGLIERPQNFFTFGGQDAGDLYSAVITPSGRALLGSWGGVQTGNDAMVWLPEGDKWTRQDPTKTALQSTPSLLVGPAFGTTLGESIVLVGSQVRLGDGKVAQGAAVWRSTKLNQGWSRIELPEPGNRSQASTATCSSTGCVISGYADGQLAIWQLDASGTAKRLAGVPSIPVGDKDKLPPPIVTDGKVVQIVAQDNKVKVLTGQDGKWTVQESTGGPAGPVTRAVLTPDHKLYLIAGGTLWQTTLS